LGRVFQFGLEKNFFEFLRFLKRRGKGDERGREEEGREGDTGKEEEEKREREGREEV
jgi:hypothetical protein